MDTAPETSPETDEQKPPSVTADAGYYTLSSTKSVDGRVMLGQDIEIFPGKPRLDLTSFVTPAFEARDRRLTGDQLAYVCGRSHVPRVTSIASYRNVKSPYLLRLVEAGIVDWLPERRQRLVLVYEMPAGRKMMSDPDAQPYKMHEDRVMGGLIEPILSALFELKNADLVHGAINLENIFVSGAEGAETAVLGECLSSAPFFRQHPIFVTIEQGMAQPSGRGHGAIKDDLYAFGMCVAMVVRGENLMAGKTPQQIVRDKIENTSYGIVIGRERMPPGIAEFLRGVLSDDPQQRWDIDDAMKWLEGRRLSPKQPRVNLTAARPIQFAGEKYWDLRSLSMAFGTHVQEAGDTIEKGEFDLWLRRNFEDKDLTLRLEKFWEKERSSSRDRLVSAICMCLDPLAPVHYKTLSIYPTGFGTSLAEVMARQDDVQAYAEMISGQLFNTWINLRFEAIADASGLITTFEKCRGFLMQKMPGYGIERLLYLLNKEAPCMSPILKSHFVLGPGSLLLALEDVAQRPNRPDTILDRHMMAFVSVREPKMIDPHLGHIISSDRGFQVVGILRSLSAIQKRFMTGPVPGVGNWLISMIAPAVDRYHDRDLRQEVQKRVAKLTDSGNLAALLELVDNSALTQDDSNRFAQARAEFSALNAERANIEKHLKLRATFGRATGRQVAMLISSALASFIILGYMITRFAGMG